MFNCSISCESYTDWRRVLCNILCDSYTDCWLVLWQQIMWHLCWQVKCPAYYVTVTLIGNVFCGCISCSSYANCWQVLRLHVIGNMTFIDGVHVLLQHIMWQLHWWVIYPVTCSTWWHVWWSHIMSRLHWQVMCPVTVTLMVDIALAVLSCDCYSEWCRFLWQHIMW